MILKNLCCHMETHGVNGLNLIPELVISIINSWPYIMCVGYLKKFCLI